MALNGTSGTYTTATSSNRLLSTTNSARTFAYDNAGNTTSDTGGYTSTYNLAGRLTTLVKGGVTSTYSYDANGQRIRKCNSTGFGQHRDLRVRPERAIAGRVRQRTAAAEACVTLSAPSPSDVRDWDCSAPQARLVRQIAPNGEIRALLTNLDATQFPMALFAGLYPPAMAR